MALKGTNFQVDLNVYLEALAGAFCIVSATCASDAGVFTAFCACSLAPGCCRKLLRKALGPAPTGTGAGRPQERPCFDVVVGSLLYSNYP